MAERPDWGPLDRVEYGSFLGGELPPPRMICEGMWVVPLPNPGNYAGGTLCYVVRDGGGGIHLIDPGPGGSDALAALDSGLRQGGAGMEDVVGVYLTHLHPDHRGLAEDVRRLSGARVFVSRDEVDATRREAGWAKMLGAALDGWGVPDERRDVFGPPPVMTIDADVLLEDGDRLEIDGWDFRVERSPGHTAGHVTFAENARRLILLGDHVLPHLNPGIGYAATPSENPVVEYVLSLGRTERQDFAALPGHGYGFGDLTGRCRAIRNHHLKRSREIDALRVLDPDASVWAIASRLRWRNGWDGLTPGMRRHALQQTESHLAALSDEVLRRVLLESDR
jgi:glyoxylase-like metal-dependent hydrolase (beta-lactamase superfamily II)